MATHMLLTLIASEQALLLDALLSQHEQTTEALRLLHKRNPGALACSQFRTWLKQAEALQAKLQTTDEPRRAQC